MKQKGSARVVIAALGFNALIALAKFAAAVITGSSAMLSEALHSLLDTSNQGLLLHGLKVSERPADREHPFGHSMEVYFYSFVVAVILFSLGAGISIYEGIEKLLNPRPIEFPQINYAVLGVAIVLEIGSLVVALKEFNVRRRGEGLLRALRRSKDPALFTVLLEDVAAITGLLTALVGVGASHLLGRLEADGIAAIGIGLILALVAAFIAIEIKSLLIGEAASEELQTGLRSILEGAVADRRVPVRGINEIRTLQLGPRDVLVTASLDFEDDVSAGEVERTTAELDGLIRAKYPDVNKLYIEVQAADDHARHMESGATPLSREASRAPEVKSAPAPASSGSPQATAKQPSGGRPNLASRPKHSKKGKRGRR